MGCGCRKNKTVQPVQQPVPQPQVQVQENVINQQNGSQLTQDQQQQVDIIMDKIKQLNP